MMTWRTILILSLGALSAHAEHSGRSSGGRPVFDNGASQVDFVNMVSACLVGRADLNTGIGARVGDSPGGLLQVTPPAGGGAPVAGPTGAQASGPNAAVFMAKCAICHNGTKVAMKPANAMIAAAGSGVMPPAKGSPRDIDGLSPGPLSAAEKQAITTFLQTGR